MSSALRRSPRLAQKANAAELASYEASRLPVEGVKNTFVMKAVISPSEQAIMDVCEKKDAIYTPELLVEYNTWRSSARDYYTKVYDLESNTMVSKDESLIATYWANFMSPTLLKQYHDSDVKKHIKKFCDNNGLKYTAKMYQDYCDWAASDVKNTTRPGGYFEKNQRYQITPSACVQRWIKTIIKIVLAK